MKVLKRRVYELIQPLTFGCFLNVANSITVACIFCYIQVHTANEKPNYKEIMFFIY